MAQVDLLSFFYRLLACTRYYLAYFKKGMI